MDRPRKRTGAVLSFQNVHYEVVSRGGFGGCGAKEVKAILKNVNGIFRPGMNAIMGPTGCGKTSLLNVLAARKDPKGMSGLVLINGQKQPENFNCMSGYVTQDDVIMGTLTVRENLLFSAALRLPKSVSVKEKKHKVQEVIEELGLTECADSKVGTPLIRGVSGGERKRTNIGMEMITSPKVLFLDEPTTGLDSHTAHTVMEVLQQLSLKGQTMIFSIHQPRYSIYKLFDSLMLLYAGEVTYHGASGEALDYFANAGYICEPHNNPADFFLDVLSGTLQPNCESAPTLDVSEDDIGVETVKHSSVITPDVEIGRVALTTKPRSALPQQYELSSHKAEAMKQLESIRRQSASALLNSTEEDNSNLDYATSFGTQLYHVSKRALLNLVRNPAFTVLQVLVMIFISTVVGTIYFQVDESRTSGIQNRVGAFFFVCMNMIFANLSSVEPFIQQRALFVHEKANGYYRTSAYFLGKFFCDVIPNRSIPIILYATVSYWMIGLRPEAGHFFMYMLDLILTSVTATSLCFAVSSGVTVYAIANLGVTLCYVIMMIFSGLLVNLDTMPDWLSWLKYISVYRYSLEALEINELKDLNFCDRNVNGTESCLSGEEYLQMQGIPYNTAWDYWRTQVALLSILISFMIIAYIQLRRVKKYT